MKALHRMDRYRKEVLQLSTWKHGINVQYLYDSILKNSLKILNKQAGLQPISRTCGTTPFGFQDSRRKTKHSVLEKKTPSPERFKGESTYMLCWCISKVSFGGTLGVDLRGVGGGIKIQNWFLKLWYKTCVPQVTRQVYNLFQDLWHRFIIWDCEF